MSPKEEFNVKHQRILGFLEQHGLDGVLLTRRCNFSWYTGGGLSYVNMAAEPGVGTLLVTRDGAVCLSANIESGRLGDEEVGGLGIECEGFPWHDSAAAAKAYADAIGGRAVAADVRLPVMPDAVVAMPAGFDELRWSLTAAEVERYRKLGADVGHEVEQVCRGMAVGDREYEIAARITGGLGARGIRTWVCLVAADRRLAKYRHPIPTDRRIERIAMAVACGERHGLICSITRIVSFGPLDAELARRHRAVCQVDAAMIEAARPERTLGDVWDAMVKAYADTGFPDEWRLHHQGGPTGYLTRDARTTPGNAIRIQPNQAFAWNPSIAGTKSEDTTLATADGHSVLTQTAEWPVLELETASGICRRADILVR